MSCCKSTNTEFTSENKTGGNYIGRIIYFVSGVIGFTILLPFLWIGLVYLIFNSTILNLSSVLTIPILCKLLFIVLYGMLISLLITIIDFPDK